jgi:hypothetical protein
MVDRDCMKTLFSALDVLDTLHRVRNEVDRFVGEHYVEFKDVHRARSE